MISAGCVGIAALAGGLSLSVYAEPDPRTASREAILRHLATHDVRSASPTKLDGLVDRLALEMQQGIAFSGTSGVTLRQRRTLLQNVEALKHRWFVSRVDHYDNLASNERPAYLDEQIDTLLAWTKVDAALAATTTSATPASASAARFFNDIERWIAHEPNAQQQARMQGAVSAGIVRWLATHNIAQQSPAVRRELSLAIAAGLDAGIDAALMKNARTFTEQSRLRENGRLLMEAWLLAQAEAYASIAPSERGAFLDARIDEVTRWRIHELLSEGQSSTRDSPALVLAELGKLTDLWIARADPVQQAQLRTFASDVQGRLVLRMIQALRGK